MCPNGRDTEADLHSAFETDVRRCCKRPKFRKGGRPPSLNFEQSADVSLRALDDSKGKAHHDKSCWHQLPTDLGADVTLSSSREVLVVTESIRTVT